MSKDPNMGTGKGLWDKFFSEIQRPIDTLLGWKEEVLMSVLSEHKDVTTGQIAFNALERADIIDYWKTLRASSNNNNAGGPGQGFTEFQNAYPNSLTFGDSGLLFSDVEPKTLRSSTTKFLAEQMFAKGKEQRVILIRAPPGTGKTSLAQILQRFFMERGALVNFVDLTKLKDKQYGRLVTTIDTTGANNQPYILLLDEGQYAYTRTAALPLWRRLKSKSSSLADTPNAYVIVFAAYGNNRPSGDFDETHWREHISQLNNRLGYVGITDDLAQWIYDDCKSNMGVLDEVANVLHSYFGAAAGTARLTEQTLASLPAYAACKQQPVVAFTPFGFPVAYGAYLLYARRDEVDDYFAHANHLFSREGLHLRISAEIVGYLFTLTRGHLGYLAQALRMIYNQFKVRALQDPAHNPQIAVTDAVLIQFLCSKSFVENLKLFRAAPTVSVMVPAEKARVMRHLFEPKLPLPSSPEERAVVYSLMKKGVLFYSDGTFEQGYSLSRDMVDFISPIIALLCFVDIYGAGARTTFANNNIELGQFLKKVVAYMDPTILKATQGRGLDNRHLERVWQMEFYRVATSLLSLLQFVSPEVGGLYGLAKRCDFYVNSDLCWLIEVVRDGDKLAEHLERFGIGGGHGQYLHIPHKDYAIVDFYTGALKQLPCADPHYWAVEIHGPEYNLARISHTDNSGKVSSEQIMLVGHADAFIVHTLEANVNKILL